jgi:serine O-acetyltransferase
MKQLSDLLDADWAQLAALSNAKFCRRRMRHMFSPRFAPVVLIRVAQCLYSGGWLRLAKLPAFVNFFIFGIEVPPRMFIGPGLVLMHTQGTVLGAARMGSNVTIYHQVTLGAVSMDFAYTSALRPVVGDGVVIGVGAKVLGELTLGDGCVIGANAVVLKNVPAGKVAVGIPAQILLAKSEREGSSRIGIDGESQHVRTFEN